MERYELLRKIRTLSEYGAEGDAQNAERLLAILMKNYSITEAELESVEKTQHKFVYHGSEERTLLLQIIYKVTSGKVFRMRNTHTGRLIKSKLAAECSVAEAVEIQCLFSFYASLWESEKRALLLAFIQKYSLFSLYPKPDIQASEPSPDEMARMIAYVGALQDAPPHKALKEPSVSKGI